MKRAFLQIILLFVSKSGIAQEQYPVSYTLPEKIEVKTGAAFAVPVFFKLEDPWYIYAPTGNNAAQGMIETNIIFNLPKGIIRKGKIQLPKSKYKGGFEVYEGKGIKFNLQFAVNKDALPGDYIIKGKITYQTCNEKICLPPVTDEINITVFVKGDTSVVSDIDSESEKSKEKTTTKNVIADINNEPLLLKFTSIDGRKIDIAKLKGKLVLIDCWATWCRPCIAEFDNLKKMYQKYHSKGFEVIGIAVDETTAKQRVKDLISKNKLPWPQRFEGKGFNNDSFIQSNNITSLPAVFLLDKEGKIIDRDARGERLEELIKKYLTIE